jgi:Zn-finger protein
MKHSFKYFRNCDCEYFPCHQTNNPESFNCLFCFCPLYFKEDCGGNYILLDHGVKDCSGCMFPHCPENYDELIVKLSK